MGELSRDEFYHALAAVTKAVDSGFESTHARLDRINGRVGTSENKITAIETRMDEREKQASKDNPARAWGIGSALGGILYAAWHAFNAGAK